MKLPTSLKLAGATAAALATNALLAEVALNEQFAISGYVVGSASYAKAQGVDSDSNADLDATKLTAVAKFAPLTVTTSLFAFGTGSGDGFNNSPIFLDAYGTYDLGNGSSVTAGKYLSWLGYEAFDPINMLQISYANPTAAYIPGYHTGVKFENSTDAYSIGVGISDSLYGPAYYKGDGDLNNGVGLEAYFTYKAIKDFTLFAGLGYDTGDSVADKRFVGDLWVQYVYGQFTFAGEVCYGSTDYSSTIEGESTIASHTEDGYFILGLVKYQANDKWAATFRLSAGQGEAGDDFVRGTFAPTYSVTKNLDLVAEYSYTELDEDAGNADYAHYLGLQARFKF
ncbi:MAG TPA: outer membrane beta-barrel protein [Opitutaceae bacterium]|nr:outer membrane beta-barrel protein [Opitutaceae bacterium]